VEPQPISSQDEIVISNVCDIDLNVLCGFVLGILQLEVLDRSVVDHTFVFWICLHSVLDGFSQVLGSACFSGVVFVDDESFSTLSNSTCALISYCLLATNLTLIAIEGVTAT